MPKINYNSHINPKIYRTNLYKECISLMNYRLLGFNHLLNKNKDYIFSQNSIKETRNEISEIDKILALHKERRQQRK